MSRALEGDRDAAREFFVQFYSTDFFLPSRTDQGGMSEMDVPYPQRPFEHLGIFDGEKPVLPIFLRLSSIEGWARRPLPWQKLSGTQVLAIVPQGWWITMEPGGEIEKEFTPWEIQKLAAGKEAIPEVLDELYAPEDVKLLNTMPLPLSEYQDLQSMLVKKAENLPEVEVMYVLREKSLNAEGEESSNILIGVLYRRNTTRSRTEFISTELTTIANLAMVGAERIKLFSNIAGSEDIRWGMFQGVTPLYANKPSWRKWFNIFK